MKRSMIDEPTLRRLYEVDHLTTRQIADKLGVVKTSVRNWMQLYGITSRPSGRPDTMANRGVPAPSREELVRLVHTEHHSFEQIGAIFGVAKTTVSKWLKNHGIEAPKMWETRRKGVEFVLPDAETLADLYYSGLSVQQIAIKYGVSSWPIASLCKQFGIERRLGGWDGAKRHTSKSGHAVRSGYELTVADWLFDHQVEFTYEPKLPFGNMRGDFLANGWYIEVWGVQSSTYEVRKAKKVQNYRDHGLSLIELSKHYFAAGRRHMIDRKLNACLEPPSLLRTC